MIASTLHTAALARTIATASFVASFATGCRDAALSLAPTRAEARAQADTLIGAFAARFGPYQSDSAFARFRFEIGRSALVPSRVFGDTSLWTQHDGESRTVELSGAPGADRYRIILARDATASPPPSSPARAGEYRGLVRLTALGHGEYSWRVRDALAIGSVRTARLGDALTELFIAAARTSDDSARAAYRQSLPRTTAALGRLFSLDTLALAPAPDGSTGVTLGVTMHTKGIEQDFPDYARWLHKYLSSSSYAMIVTDPSGKQWWDARAGDDRATVHFRVRDGSLAPSDGAPLRMPDSVRVRIDVLTKSFIFHVGVRELVGDVTLTRAEREKAFTARFRRNPHWVLPPLVGWMIRSPLRRPFQGEGAWIELGVRDSIAAQTIVAREYQLAVKESAIMRWFGGLGSSALNDFRGRAQEQADRFIGEALGALRADVAAMLGPPGGAQ